MKRFWYALHVRSRAEKLVQIQLESKGYEIFLPTYVSARCWSDRVRTFSEPLFPNYVLCRFEVHTRPPILTTPGVNCVLGAGKTPVAVDETEIATIRDVMKSGAALEPCPYLTEGERVRVVTGPLNGLRVTHVRS
jgi:transcription termination/antitermination protein NusG